jgi:tetratricopeptide (TPR) repeat protein
VVYRLYRSNLMFVVTFMGAAICAEEEIPHHSMQALCELAKKQSHAEQYFTRGITAYNENRINDAIADFEQAITENPSLIYAHLHLIGALEHHERYQEALSAAKRLLSMKPLQREGLLSAGIIAKKLHLFEDAAWYYRTLYNHYPDDHLATIELAGMLVALDQYEEALELYTKALTLEPSSIVTFYNLGFTLKKLGYIEQAIGIYTQILNQKPEYALAHFSRSLAYLTMGNFEEGWAEYEWRWLAGEEQKPNLAIPLWDGTPLLGKKIYVYAEQGLGDTFQFVRYLQQLKNDGAYVIFAPQRALIPLMKLLPYIDEVKTIHEPCIADYHAPLMSLPWLCKTTLETIPAPIPYLKADSDLVTSWKSILDAAAGNAYRVGICWHGNAQYKDPALQHAVEQKSCALKQFAELATIPNVQLFSLQKMSGLKELETLEDASFLTVFDKTLDTVNGRFMDTAAIIAQLDLVITIDTSIAHLAGALGIETWVLLPEPADWRWMRARTDSPWYPTMHIFRQQKRGDWQRVMHEVTAELRQKIATKGLKHV